MTRRAWIAAAVVAVLVVSGAAALGVRRHQDSCGRAVTRLPASESTSPFLDAAGRRDQPDARRDRAVAALSGADAAFGPVLGAVGYDYQQWAQLSAYADGLGVRTRDNPDFTLLDDRLRPRWSVQVDTTHSAYDADGSRYLVATLPRTGSPDLVAMSLRSGRRLWCTSLGGPEVRTTDPFSTALILDQVAVLGPGSHQETLTLLDAHGKRRWQHGVRAGRGDYLGTFGDLLLAGGDEQYRLADPDALSKAGDRVALSAVSTIDGSTRWRLHAAAGTGLHVVGVTDTVAVVEQADHTGAWLRGIDEDGHQLWRVRPYAGVVPEAALRSGRVLTRSGVRWSAYDADSGRLLWTRTMPTRPQLLPYGFSLDEVPLLDDDHALIGTTTALRVLDLRTGRWTSSAPLPTDGISTTYWPYQLAVTDHLIAVATNTSAIVLRRTDG